jgi:hypothetical protein
MKRSTKNNVRMYDAVRATFETHQAAWSENPALAAGVEKFNTVFEELTMLSLKHANHIAGIKEERRVYFDDLIQKAMILRDGLSVFAFEKSKFSVYEKLNFTALKLRAMTQLELRIRMTTIYELVTEYEDQLSDYGITTEKIMAFLDLFESFDDQIVAVRKGTIERKFVTKRIDTLQAELRILLTKKIDILARLISVEHPEFFADYKSARIVIEKKNAAKQPPESDIDIGAAS